MIKSSEQLFADTPYIRRVSSLSPGQLHAIDEHLQVLLRSDSKQLRKTHYFQGRYENIYVNDLSGDGFDDLQQLIDESLGTCAQLLRVPVERLKIGFWFNLMEPEQVTTLHRHDDYDELISGVVYLKVPPDSGDLVLMTPGKEIVLPPICGNFIYFAPETPHRVTENCSNDRRLSIGMNIGLRD